MSLSRAFERILGWRAEPVRLADLDVPLGGVRRALLALIVFLVPVNLFVGYLKWSGVEDDEQPLVFFRFFDLGEEHNLPAWVATLLLAGAGLSALVASQLTDGDRVVRRGFVITGAALFYVSLDEASYLHERTSEPVRDLLGAGGALYWAWIIPAMVAVAILAIVLWPFLQRLPVQVRNDLLLSAAVYVGCAVGLEMLDGLAFAANDEEANAITEVLTIIEEVGEMLAAMLAIDTLLRYAASDARPASASGQEVGYER